MVPDTHVVAEEKIGLISSFCVDYRSNLTACPALTTTYNGFQFNDGIFEMIVLTLTPYLGLCVDSGNKQCDSSEREHVRLNVLEEL